MSPLPRSSILSRHRFNLAEPLWWGLALGVIILFPEYLAVGTSVLVMVLFVLSYDLLLGFAGVLSLGHTVFFGIGAYAAGLLALAGWTEAVTGVLAAGAISAVLAAALGPFLLRLRGLPLIMITLSVGLVFFEAASKATWLTGGDDGLSGIELAPLFGRFGWGMYGHTKYLYALGWLFFLFYLTRRIVASPFGVALQGIRENDARMRLMGNPVLPHLVVAYVISAAIAGIAGALLTQTNSFVGLGVMGLDNSIDVLIMLVLGGVGRLFGGFIGAPVYMLVKHFASLWGPYYWMFMIGALLIVVVRVGRGGLLGIIERVTDRLTGRGVNR